jgi:hypothetical protein
MISVRKISVHEFRGIRNLEIDFKKKNFAICGKNGTGKSGIVDALEFGLTGDISRLWGSGTGGISLKEHAPHVDSRSNPAKSKVVITVFISSLNKEVTIERSVIDIQKPVISPSTPAILEVLNEVASHPEFTLSRRELIKYVISTPGDRAKEVQSLLRLEKVENLRTVLQRIANADKRDVAPLKKQKDEARQQLLTALEVTEFTAAKILPAVNSRRNQLGLPALTELTATTSFRDGLTLYAADKAINISKPQAVLTINSVVTLLKSYTASVSDQALKDIKTKIDTLSADTVLLTSLTRESFLRSAVQFVEDDCCPVCDTELGLEELTAILKKKLDAFEKVSAQRKALENDLEPYCDTLRKVIAEIRGIKEYGALLKPIINTIAFDSFITETQGKLNKIKAFLPIDELVSSLADYGNVAKAVDLLIQSIENAVKAIPEPSQQDAAREYLIISQEKLKNYRTISSNHKQAVDKEAISLSVFETYGKVVTATLEELYKDVEANFTELYRFINEDDESAFTAQLTPSIGKLGFNVDFYGRGYFPPGAYHSEGHQDGMGLCLYLALMKHILGDNFTFAVLDDVLMSVDTGHRREVCKLLKEKFPNTQFILTTHDDVWLKHMKTAGLIQPGSSIQFRKWDVDNGPNEWNEQDVWGEIANYLKGDDVRAAASLLRHYLEYISADISHKLRAKVEFRGDAQFMLGDLLPSATSQFSKLLDDGIKAANSWGKADLEEKLKQKRTVFKELVTNAQLEQWQTNAAIHYNEWANLDGKDFEPVSKAYKQLIEGFCCTEDGCKSILYLIPERGERDSLRCACGTTNINLKKK